MHLWFSDIEVLQRLITPLIEDKAFRRICKGRRDFQAQKKAKVRSFHTAGKTHMDDYQHMAILISKTHTRYVCSYYGRLGSI